MEKEFLVKKFCDQKDKDFREYSFVRNLQVNEEGMPIIEELEKIIELEDANKSIAFFIGEDGITMFTYKNNRKFCKQVLTQYETNYNEDTYKDLYIKSDEKTMNFIREEIEYIKEKNAKIIGYNGREYEQALAKGRRLLRK